jgi:hypothetical protein
VVSRRLAVASAVLIVLSACGGVTVSSDKDRPDEPIKATAYSKVDGVETWDLTGQPTKAAFGIEDDSNDSVYETQEPRSVRVLLPGRIVEMQAVLVTFTSGAGDYSFAVRTPQLKPEPLTEAFRDVLRQLQVDETPADTFAQKVAAAPSDQSERINVGATSVVLGQWSVGPAAGIAPLAGSGRVIFSGTWPPL